MILIDTDIVVDLLRDHQPARQWLTDNQDKVFSITGFTEMELIAGCRDRHGVVKVDSTIRALSTVWIEADACQTALHLFRQFRLSHSLDLVDALNAAAALSLGVPLYTFNQKHYAPISGLRTVGPYSR